jgi:hypothetical protein
MPQASSGTSFLEGYNCSSALGRLAHIYTLKAPLYISLPVTSEPTTHTSKQYHRSAVPDANVTILECLPCCALGTQFEPEPEYH